MKKLLNELVSSNQKILVVGDIMLDKFISGDVKRMSPEGPIPVLSNIKLHSQLGGAANVCKNISSIGLPADIMGVIGQDDAGDDIISLLKKDNISTSLIFRTDNKTTVKTRFLSNDNHQFLRVDNESFLISSEAFEVQIIKKFKSIIDQYKIVVISDYAKGFLSYNLTKEIISIANFHNKKVIVDPKSNSVEKYKGAFIIKPNLLEFKQFIGNKNITLNEICNKSDEILNSLKLERLLITCGELGIVLLRKGYKAYYISSDLRTIKDVSGAGDTITAIVAIGLTLNYDMEQIINISNYCAGVSVERAGTSVITIDDIKDSLGFKAKIINDEKFLKYLCINNQNKKIVFTNGCFDLIHLGHIELLKAAKKLGDKLIVGINCDNSIKKLKGKNRPINNISERAALIASLPFVDWVVPFDNETPIELIKLLKPDILVKGDDYSKETIVGSKFVESYGGKIVIIPHTYNTSTSKIIDKIVLKGEKQI